ncbi:hypothetical protein [Roseivivax isoporae]|uniref:DUF2269 family protein n=1 Tax=Roseivivax isoporae LMG 25204 TaxID=1449351 RepID=X7F2Y2_9RHOB|nr:hypothetical protein [Roseivivax isoporae]ETX27150.1 hypothetical protein RISW2_15290 [Roseivivax isoporae LMG 25204]
MDLVSVLKSVHVLAACLWVGGVVVFAMLTLPEARDRARRLVLLSQLAPLGPRLFTPASLTVLATGPVLAWVGGWGMPAWLVAALAAAAGSVALGVTVLAPGLEKVALLTESGEGDWAGEVAANLRWATRLDLSLLVFALLMMVAKPGWDAVPVVGAPVLLLFVLLWLTARQPATGSLFEVFRRGARQ